MIETWHANQLGTRTNGIVLQNGAIGDPMRTTAAGTPLQSPGDVKANSVSLFACDSSALAEQYQGATFTGVESGEDRVTNSVTLEQAAGAFLERATAAPATQPLDLAAAAAAANRVVTQSRNTLPNGQDIDVGDTICQGERCRR